MTTDKIRPPHIFQGAILNKMTYYSGRLRPIVKKIKQRLINFYISKYNEVRLPFLRKALIATDKYNWLKLDASLIAQHSLRKGFQSVFLKRDGNTLENKITIDLKPEQISQFSYKGINLYEVTIYQICVELQVFINDLDFSDPLHFKVIKQWFKKAAAYIDFILPYFQKFRFDKAVILQGYLYESAIIRWICIQRNIPLVAVENTFNSDKFIWDDVACISVNKNLAVNYYYRYADIIDYRTAQNYCLDFLTNIKSKKLDEHASPQKTFTLNNDKKTIFYIGQVYTDASTLFGIGNFHSPVSIVEYLAKYATQNDCNLVIKLHPKEISGLDICNNRYNSLTHRQIMANSRLTDAINQNDNIHYDHNNTFDTYSIIRHSDVCVTVNSQAGLESVLLGKPVITCGNAFYNCLDQVYHAIDDHQLENHLNRLFGKTEVVVDMAQVYKFFYIFCEKYCLPKTEKAFICLLDK
jgi:hypothetical protein